MTDDDPITLKDACEKFFAGAFTIATLRAEHRRGNLEVYRIGKRDFTTLRDLREMQRKCRVAHKAPVSISTHDESSGLSEMDKRSSALAALSQTTKALKSSSPNISAANTNRRRAQAR